MVYQVRITACCGESWTYMIVADNTTQLHFTVMEFIETYVPCAEYRTLNMIRSITPPWDRYYQLGLPFIVRLSPGEFVLTQNPSRQAREIHLTGIRAFDIEE